MNQDKIRAECDLIRVLGRKRPPNERTHYSSSTIFTPALKIFLFTATMTDNSGYYKSSNYTSDVMLINSLEHLQLGPELVKWVNKDQSILSS
jgi:hypothetical protein